MNGSGNERAKHFSRTLIYCLVFRGLSLFEQWTDDALKNVCFEAQIQEVRNIPIMKVDTNATVRKRERERSDVPFLQFLVENK